MMKKSVYRIVNIIFFLATFYFSIDLIKRANDILPSIVQQKK